MFRVVVLACAVLTAAVTGCGPRAGAGAGRASIYVSIPPQAVVAERIAGDRFDVHVLLGSGSSHEAYEPKPSQMRQLAEADVYVRAEVPFENAAWDRIRGANPRMRVVRGFDQVPAREMNGHAGHEGHEGHDHGPTDPHMWLDPANMKIQAQELAAALAELDPEHADAYRERLAALLDDFDALDRDLRALLAPVAGGEFWVYHPAWGYFADAYGLHQRAIEQEGHEVGSRTLGRLIEEARREGVRVIFVDPTTSSRNARVLADEIGARVSVIDPAAPDYFDNLRRAAQAIAEALT